MNFSNYTGWDIGGAHLKVASINNDGRLEWVEQFATPLWKGIDQLETVIPETMGKLSSTSTFHGLTMTAELVDIFNDRVSGMHTLLDMCEKHLGNNISLYATDKGLLSLEKARKNIDQVASANWHASANYTASQIESGVFIDIGSTTTDIIPFSNSKINSRGFNDQDRLRFDELIYTGVIRTSLMALTNKAPFEGLWQNLAMEHFATTADVYRILGCLHEDDDLMDSADGNSKDIDGSIRRLARMLGTDSCTTVNQNRWYKLAEYFQEVQLQMLCKGVLRILSTLPTNNQKIVGAGVGRFLVNKIAQRLSIPYIEFSEICNSDSKLSHKCNVCAPAVSLAQLSRFTFT